MIYVDNDLSDLSEVYYIHSINAHKLTTVTKHLAARVPSESFYDKYLSSKQYHIIPVLLHRIPPPGLIFQFSEPIFSRTRGVRQ